MVVDAKYIEPHHQNQNKAERRGGTVKAWTTHLLLMTKAPLDYWCYAMEFILAIRSVIAKRSLEWRTPHELQFGDTPELGTYRFLFWQPVWYYCKESQFPNHKMRKGRFLGFSSDTTDMFCYQVLTIPDEVSETSKVLVRSVVRPRYRAEPAPDVYTRTDANTIVFANMIILLNYLLLLILTFLHLM